MEGAATATVTAPPLDPPMRRFGRAVYYLWYRELLRYFREPVTFYGSLVRPVLWLFVLGVGMQAHFRGGDATGGLSFTQYIFPGIVTMSVLFTGLFQGVTMIFDREFGFLKEIMVAPVPTPAILLGKLLGGTTLAMIQGVVVLVFAPLVDVAFPLVRLPAVLAVMFVMALGTTAIGLLIAQRMTSFEGFGTIVNFLVFPLYFLSGAMFPPTGLPAWLQVLVYLDPLAYGVDAFRHLILGQGVFPLGRDLVLLCVVSGALVLVNLRLFKRSG
ncbi:MAG TPA: ABC transporter permease [bacterium]|nr:ABC transporter permease [bacterium]